MAENLMKDLLLDQVLVSDGFMVDFAVGTTYSLDMETLLAVPLTMGLMGDAGEGNVATHVLMEAIRASADKFAVFCNAGCIAVPRKNSRVFSLLENCVNQVTLPAQGKGFVNFHPKVWIVKQTNPEIGITRLKVSVMSRNLTSSSDMDAVCVLEGTVRRGMASEESLKKHKPLRDFIIWLANQPKISKRREIIQLAEALDHVEEFELDDKRFDSYDFYPIGISEEYNGMSSCLQIPEFAKYVNQAIVISPFIDEPILRLLARPGLNGEKTLITRQEYVNQEILEMFNDGVYAVKDTLKEEAEGARPLDLHMKMYFINARGWNYLYLGSANATRNAFNRNVEFMLGLRFRPNQYSYRKFREEFIYDRRDCRFEQLTTPASVAEEPTSNEEEMIIRKVASSIYSAKASRNDDGTFRVKITHKKLRSDQPIFLSPLQAEGKKSQLEEFETTFDGMRLVELSDFYIVSVGEMSRIISIPTSGIPTEERDTAIFRSFIDTKEKFLNYLNFMLAEDKEEYLGEMAATEEINESLDIRKDEDMSSGLYETMLRLAYSNPTRIKDIARIMDKVDPSVVPEGFTCLYSQFENAIKHLPKP